MNNQNKSFQLRKLTVAAVFTALITVMTMVSLPIPGGHGYIHLGDSMIYACAWAVGGPLGAAAAAIGSALADILLGWTQYAPATFVIKFAMGFVCFAIMKVFSYRTWSNVFAMVVAAVILVVGYISFEYLLTGIGGATAALGSNLIQGAGGVVLGTIIVIALDKVKALDQFVAWKAEKKDE